MENNLAVNRFNLFAKVQGSAEIDSINWRVKASVRFDLFFIDQILVLRHIEEEDRQLVLVDLSVAIDVHLLKDDVDSTLVYLVTFEEGSEELFDLRFSQVDLPWLRCVLCPNFLHVLLYDCVNAHAFFQFLLDAL